MSEEVPVCPECDSTDVSRTNCKTQGTVIGKAWTCRTCGIAMDEVDYRERYNSAPKRTSSPHANALIDADPDEVGT